MDNNDHISRLPAETIIQLLCSLSCLRDVFSLTATCRRLQTLWQCNVAPIFDSVAPTDIACLPYALTLFANQEGKEAPKRISLPTEVHTIVRNACIVDKAILEFEKIIVCKVRTGGYGYRQIYGPNSGHPKHLTNTERPRFIRAYYTFWGLMKLNPPLWRPRIKAVRLKDLYPLYEMTKLTQNIGGDEVLFANPLNDNANPAHDIPGYNPSSRRIALGRIIEEIIEKVFTHLHGKPPDSPYALERETGNADYVTMWDHWQSDLRDIVCGSSRSESYRPELWDDDPGEEHLFLKD